MVLMFQYDILVSIYYNTVFFLPVLTRLTCFTSQCLFDRYYRCYLCDNRDLLIVQRQGMLPKDMKYN